jgi:hypothetical protein
MKYFFSFILLIIFYSSTFAQLSPYEINGYVKYLFSSAKYPEVSERYDDHLIHARLNTHWYPVDNFKAVMEMRFRAYYGESVENIPNFKDQIKGNYDYLNLDAVLWNKKKTVGYGEIDRLYLDWNYKEVQLTLGRQRIAWGTSWVWNPTDIFNPQSVLDFDYEERPAVDAFHLQYYTGAVSKVEAAFKPAKEKKNIIAAGLISNNFSNYDFNIIGGVKKEKWFTGFSWAGDIYGAGFRGEFILNQGRKTNVQFTNLTLGSDNPYYSFVLSGDYTFQNSFYIHTEVLHNSIGIKRYTLLYQKPAIDFGLLTAARWSVYQEFAYDFHPLIRGSVFGIFNTDDKSLAIVPSVSYSVITNLDLILLVMYFHGDAFTEYGSYGSTVFFRAKYSF